MKAEHALYASALTDVREQFSALTGRNLTIDELAIVLKENFAKRKQELQSELDGHAAHVDILKKEVESLQANHLGVLSDLEIKSKELAEVEKRIPQLRSVMKQEEINHGKTIKDLNDKIVAAKKEHSQITTEAAIKHTELDAREKWILTEESRLSRRNRDIAIYEQRVLKAGQALDPNFKMIL